MLDNSFQIFQTRISKLDIEKPKIVTRNKPECISIELSGIENTDLLRELLVKNISIEFWKTYKCEEIYNDLHSINLRSEEHLKLRNDTAEKRLTPSEDFKFDKPFFKYLKIDEASRSIVGLVNRNDTAAVNEMLRLAKNQYPLDLKFAWRYNSVDSKSLELYALRGSGIKGGPILDGDYITSFKLKGGFMGQGKASIEIRMNSVGASFWSSITGREVGNTIAIVVNGNIYSAASVNERIEGGRVMISGDKLTIDDLKPLVILFNSGKMPVDLYITNEEVITPTIKH